MGFKDSESTLVDKLSIRRHHKESFPDKAAQWPIQQLVEYRLADLVTEHPNQ